MQLWCLQTVSSYVTENMCTVEWAQWWSKCMFLFPTTVPTLRGRITTTPNQSPWQLPLVIHYISETFNALAAAVLYFVCLRVWWLREEEEGGLVACMALICSAHTPAHTHTRYLSVIAHTGGLIRRCSDVSSPQLIHLPNRAADSGEEMEICQGDRSRSGSAKQKILQALQKDRKWIKKISIFEGKECERGKCSFIFTTQKWEFNANKHISQNAKLHLNCRELYRD